MSKLLAVLFYLYSSPGWMVVEGRIYWGFQKTKKSREVGILCHMIIVAFVCLLGEFCVLVLVALILQKAWIPFKFKFKIPLTVQSREHNFSILKLISCFKSQNIIPHSVWIWVGIHFRAKWSKNISRNRIIFWKGHRVWAHEVTEIHCRASLIVKKLLLWKLLSSALDLTTFVLLCSFSWCSA